jgi:hypothetical protein
MAGIVLQSFAGLILPPAWREAKGFFRRQACLKSASQGRVPQALPFSPGRHRERYAKSCYQPVVAAIKGLLFWSSPSTVRGFVVTVVVDSIKRVAQGRLAPHVRNEFGEIKPSITNLYPTTTVSCITQSFGVKTPHFHRGPSSILRGHVQPVFCDARKCHTPTAARSLVEIGTINDRLIATVALGAPEVPSSVTPNKIQDRKFSEASSCQVDAWLARLELFTFGWSVKVAFRHLVSSITLMFRGRGMFPHPSASLCLSIT